MNKLILISVIIGSLFTSNANSAKNTEVYRYDRATELATAAIKSKNYSNAAKYLIEASKLGNKVSQYSLALLYIAGEGVEQNYTEAYLWLNVASEANEKRWHELKDQIHNALSKEQVNSLKPQVEDYINKYGAIAQQVNCKKRAVTGSNIRSMECLKKADIGSTPFGADTLN